MSERVDAVVIGAGVVGLAVASRLALAGREVLVLERHDLIGSETSSRNSEVIHAGIYYPQGSLKARFCVQGRRKLYDYCKSHGVPYNACGKLIVATAAGHQDLLQQYAQQAHRNGLTGHEALRWLSAEQVAELEPLVFNQGALLSPSTGIIDSHAYMLALQGDLEAAGGLVALNTEVTRLQQQGDRIGVVTPELDLSAALVVNATGLSAVDIGRWLTPQVPSAHYAIGHYYTYTGAPIFQRLVYPVAQPGGLGVHVTIDLVGGIKFGPDVRWLQAIDYRFDDSQRGAFIQAIQDYFPGLETDRLQPGYTGIRPKITGPGEPAADFRIDGPATHGATGLINLFGIESPGLTSSLAIADWVVALSKQMSSA